MDKRDYYQVLGTEKNSSDADLKKAYRRLAMKFHPDRNPGDQEAEKKFKEAKEAFLLLNSPQQRYEYLLAKKPHWLAQLSLTEVAMYIGISAISLSRIRKRLNLS